jgi:hypothetical protein
MSINPGMIAFKMAYQLSPIILTGGIATSLGGALPIIALTEGAITLLAGLLTGSENLELDNFFAHYLPNPGSTLIQNEIAHYPFANQSVAANAIIAQPLNVSMTMLCPVRNLFGYFTKTATMSALQKSLAQHNSLGGTYSIATPAYLYTNCIMLSMRDVSGGDSKQAQFAWQLDFEQPLITLQAAQSALNGLMQKIAGGTQITGAPTWSSGLTIGNPFKALSNLGTAITSVVPPV